MMPSPTRISLFRLCRRLMFLIQLLWVRNEAFSYRPSFALSNRPPSTKQDCNPGLSRKLWRQQIPSRFILSSINDNNSNYGRGAEIWPPTNEDPIRLEDSFPNGQIPESARALLDGDVESSSSPKIRRWSFAPGAIIDKILRRAASAQEEEFFFVYDSEKTKSRVIDATPAVLALTLLLMGFCRPLDALLATFLSGYTWVLGVLSQSVTTSPGRSSSRPTLPALPPQGHVPALVANPLGYELTYSLAYDRWLKLGVLLGLIGPLLLLVHGGIEAFNTAGDIVTESTSAAARPLFLLSCQAVTEAMSRRFLTPLPVRIWIPVAYNSVRLGYLWKWALIPSAIIAGTNPLESQIIRALAVANFLYWFINLFGFLLPIAVMRYMRAHFFCVEAEQVFIRPGMEETMGL